jgi:response regulator RpfG family c-di-GMP phosphodiesterase
MTEKILFVDDEPHVLQSIQRQLRKRFELQTAAGGEEALQVLKQDGPFAIIVSDMRMPGMNGVELLAKVKDAYPDMVRIMLTGNADQETATEAVNTGQIFRFLTKPCPPALFITSLALAQRQYRLLTAEKELLQKTLKGSITVLSELLGLSNPMAFSSAVRFKNYVVQLAEILNLPNLWQYEISALMSQIGCVTLPGDVLSKIYLGRELNEDERNMYTNHPAVGARLLEKIPRLENVTKIIAMQQLRFDQYDEELTSKEFEEVLLGAQILKAVTDFDLHMFRGSSSGEALQLMRKEKGAYNQQIIKALQRIKVERHECIVALKVADISIGMTAAEDVVAKNGGLIIPKGQIITWPIMQGLKNFAKQVGVIEPMSMLVGQADPAQEKEMS